MGGVDSHTIGGCTVAKYALALNKKNGLGLF